MDIQIIAEFRPLSTICGLQFGFWFGFSLSGFLHPSETVSKLKLWCNCYVSFSGSTQPEVLQRFEQSAAQQDHQRIPRTSENKMEVKVRIRSI